MISEDPMNTMELNKIDHIFYNRCGGLANNFLKSKHSIAYHAQHGFSVVRLFSTDVLELVQCQLDDEFDFRINRWRRMLWTS